MRAPSEARFLGALRAARDAMAALGAPFMFIGRVAVIAHGVPRYPVDVDAAVLARLVSIERVAETARPHHLVPRREGAAAFAQQSQVSSCVTRARTCLSWKPVAPCAILRPW